MALIKCPECDKEISSLAEMCPNCAFPFTIINKVKFNIISDEEALLQLDKIDDNSAVSVLKYLAETGNIVACRELGLLYIDGKRGISKDEDQAKKYFQMGIQADDTLSYYYFIVFFSSGEDDEHRICNYEKLLSREDLPNKKRGIALNNLARLYKNAKNKDYNKAYSLYKQAISMDDSNISFFNNLQLLCFELKIYNEAIEYSNKVIALNSDNTCVALAYNTLGVCYGAGKGVDRDLNKAIDLYKKAIDLGDKTASENLGMFYNNHPEKRNDTIVERSVSSIKCPNCGSQHVEKISLANKAGAVAVFGFFAMGHISNTFKCKMCGYKW